MLNLLRRTTGGSSVAVLTLTAVLTLGGLVAAAPANAAGPVGSHAAMAVSTASVSGRVTAVSSTGGLFGLVDVAVMAYSETDFDYTTTDSAGNYTLTGLTPGDYEIGFWDGSETRTNPYADSLKTLTITTSGELVLDVTMARGSTVAGTLTQNVAGVVTPAVDTDVTVYDLDGFEIGWTWTDDLGKYRIAGLAAGTYKVGFSEFGSETSATLVPEYYNDVYTLAGAKSLVIGAGVAVTGINAEVSTVAHVNAVTPTITGTKKVGYALTANPGPWGPGTVTFKYQWYRSGVAITGATLKTYLLTGTDAADTMTVKVTGSKTGYSSRARTSVATVAIAPGLTAPTPTITGTKKVGYTLTANPGTWGPGAVTLKYQWYRSGVAISGGTAKTYKLVSTDRYDTIKVRVLGIKTGYADVAKYSVSTVKIP